MITGPRNAFIGGHVTVEIRNALRRQARAEGITVSALIARAVENELVKLTNLKEKK